MAGAQRAALLSSSLSSSSGGGGGGGGGAAASSGGSSGGGGGDGDGDGDGDGGNRPQSASSVILAAMSAVGQPATASSSSLPSLASSSSSSYTPLEGNPLVVKYGLLEHHVGFSLLASWELTLAVLTVQVGGLARQVGLQGASTRIARLRPGMDAFFFLNSVSL